MARSWTCNRWYFCMGVHQMYMVLLTVLFLMTVASSR